MEGKVGVAHDEGVLLAHIVTTVQAPTPAITQIAQAASRHQQPLIVIGDVGTPPEWDLVGCRYLDIATQQRLPFRVANSLPHGSYSRKMIGYLVAAQTGAVWLRETDDDNFPYNHFFEAPAIADATVVGTSHRWHNYLSNFSDKHLWPRGFPISQVLTHEPEQETSVRLEPAGPMVVQSLADGDPDLDAICRLVIPDATSTQFRQRGPVVVNAGAWTPFNSQATTWHRRLLTLMYLPSTCSMRLTDIWRSFVALRIMHASNVPLIVTSPMVRQVRNAHDLRVDFEEEIGGYLGYERFVDTLLSVNIVGGIENMYEDMQTLYNVLILEGFLNVEEYGLLTDWLDDVARVISPV